MKKIILANLCLLTAITGAFAQIQKIERPAQIKKIIPGEVIAPPANLVPGKDLSVSIKNFVHDPANGGSLSVTYVVRNNGTDAVDLNNVAVQGYIDYINTNPTATPPSYLVNGKYCYAGGGHVVASFSTILNGGQEKEGTYRLFNVAKEHYFNTTDSYNYTVILDKGNVVNEVNENNNSVTTTFRGYLGQYNPSLNPSQYYLTDAYMIIKTGADNKEKESEVNIRLIPNTVKSLTNTSNEFVKKVAKNELPFYSNSSTTLPLLLFMSSTATLVNPTTSLASFSLNGMGVVTEYKANFITDAWKIEQVQLVLHFKDANGLYHPTEGVKTIQFTMPANTILDGFGKRYLICKADRSFNPTTIKVTDKLSDY